MSAIDAYIEDTLTQQHIPSLSVAVVREGTPVLRKSYGMANLEHFIPATERSVYEIASVGKTFTAMLTMMLVEEGKISLDSPIALYLDAPPEAWFPVTIKHILSHQSGIPDYTQVENYWDVALSQKNLAKTEILALVSDLPLNFQPGEFYGYDNTGFYLLGLMLEKVSGQSYADLLRDRIFTPLGMKATTLHHPREIVAHRAAGYRWQNEKLVNKPFYNPVAMYSAGGLISNIEDLVKWERALHNATLLNSSTLDLMWTPIYPSLGKEWEKNKYVAGLGWQVVNYTNRRVVGHNGSVVGFASNITRFIDDKLTVIVLCNLDAVTRPDAIAKEIAGYYSDAIANLELQPPFN
jgi:CubicO group peptidase (beta-lactamase class C family)